METATALLAAGAPDAVELAPDLTAPDAVTAAFTELGERWGALNALANAAAPATQRARWYEIPDEEWYASFKVATMGPVRTRRAALALLRAAGSGAGRRTGTTWLDYARSTRGGLSANFDFRVACPGGFGGSQVTIAGTKEYLDLFDIHGCSRH